MKKIQGFINNIPSYIAYTRKAIIQIIGLAVALLALGLLPSDYAAYVATGIGILTTILHYLTPNADSPVVITATQTDAGASPVVDTVLPVNSEGDKHEATTTPVDPTNP